VNRLPTLKPNEVVRILERAGFYIDRTTGSHYIRRHPDGRGPIPVPFHRGPDVKRAVLRSIIRESALTGDEFLSLR